MSIWRRGRRSARRRSGAADEAPWWDAEDQAFAERPVLHHRDLGRGWIPVPMINNVERRDPYGDDAASEPIRAAWEARRPTALDEGAAWRRRSDAALMVARVEVFADDDPHGAHRAAWHEHGPASLDATWRQRWRERDREPGWIEARWRPPTERPDPLRLEGPAAAPEAASIDWIVVDDHTGADEADAVTAYEHLSLWSGRVLVTLTLRHHHGDDVDDVACAAALAACRRVAAAPINRRSDPRRGSA
jgi:hypothetical protein